MLSRTKLLSKSAEELFSDKLTSTSWIIEVLAWALLYVDEHMVGEESLKYVPVEPFVSSKGSKKELLVVLIILESPKEVPVEDSVDERTDLVIWMGSVMNESSSSH